MTHAKPLTPAQRVAGTILDQLGARRFMVMTGAREVVATASGLQFRLSSRITSRGVNMVRVELDSNDTYTIVVGRWTSLDFKEIERSELVHADQLKTAFSRLTGLDTHL